MLELNAVSVVFNKGKSNETTALTNVSLTVKEAEVIVMIGANGSGKSTLINAISGAAHLTSGSILLHNKRIDHIAESRRSRFIAKVFQNPLAGTAPELTVLDNFRLAAIRAQSKRLVIGIDQQFRDAVSERISVLGLGLEKKLDAVMGSLSGGQRQALTLLMSTMDTTKLLLLDEPTAALDPKTADLIMELAQKLIFQNKLTAILITHNLKYAQLVGNRLIQMREGQIHRDINVEEKTQLTPSEMVGWFN